MHRHAWTGIHAYCYSWCCVNEPPVYAWCCCCVHACVRGCACLCDRHRVSAEFFYSSAQAQQAWRIEFSYRNIDVFWKSSRHLSIGRALDAASRATRGFPKHSDICIRNHVWTKCTFGSVLYIVPVLIDDFLTWKIFHVQRVTRMAAAAVMVLNLVLLLDLQL